MKGMKVQGSSGRIVEDAAYYIGLLRKRISDVTNEMRKLNGEIESHTKETAQYSQLEKKFETLLKNKETLEGQLADYNLALDKTRTHQDVDDIQQSTDHLAIRNRQTGQELDKLFMIRKQKENDLASVEEQIEAQYRAIQARIDELEPGKLRAYNELLSRQRDYQEKILQIENKISEINSRIRDYESQDKGLGSHRKEYLHLEKLIQTCRKDAENLQEELEIASLDPKEANTKFVSRVNDLKQTTKNLDEKINNIKLEIETLRKNYDDMDTITTEDDSKDETAKYEILQKRDQEMTVFMEKFDETRNSVLEEQQKAKDIIVALLEHIGRNLEETNNMPSQEAVGEMEETKSFKEKNLATAQKTMASLIAEKQKREKDLELLRSSEPKLTKELSSLRESMDRMKSEMIAFEDIQGMRKVFDATMQTLNEQKSSYHKRRDAMRQQVQALSVEHEGIKKSINAHDIARELDDTEKRLKHCERSIFELREFVDIKSREIDFENVKMQCMKLTESINATIIKAANNQPRAQAKY